MFTQAKLAFPLLLDSSTLLLQANKGSTRRNSNNNNTHAAGVSSFQKESTGRTVAVAVGATSGSKAIAIRVRLAARRSGRRRSRG